MTAPHAPEPNFVRASAGLRPRQVPARQNAAGAVLALGGGFSRGFAHLGVLEVLEQEQVTVSAIVGTSIGGLLGAAYADGIPVREICDLGRRVRIREFLRFRRAEHGAGGSDSISQFVRERFRARAVEELPISTVIVTTDLHSAAPYLFTRGPLEVALRASCAFPGLFKPVEYSGHLLADGCIASPLPTAIAARLHSGLVLGVSVDPSTASSHSPEPDSKRFGSRSCSARRSATEPSWSRHADILLKPEVHHLAWNDFSRVDEAFAAGAEAMRRALPSLRELLARQFLPAAAPEIFIPSERGQAL